ncbi:MAG: hypothetical protein ABFR32_06330 [Bacteroidota bacterium]
MTEKELFIEKMKDTNTSNEHKELKKLLQGIVEIIKVMSNAKNSTFKKDHKHFLIKAL